MELFMAWARSLFLLLVALWHVQPTVWAQPPLQRAEQLLQEGRSLEALQLADSLTLHALPPADYVRACIVAADASVVLRDSSRALTPLDRYRKALQVAREFHLPLGEAQALNALGRYYCRQLRHTPTALKYFSAALRLATQGGDTLLQARVLNNLGVLYGNDHSDSLALRHLQRALQLRPATTLEGSAIANNIGVLLLRDKAYPEALTHFLLALSIYSAPDLQMRNRAPTMINVSECYAMLQDTAQACRWAQSAKSESLRLADSGTLCTALRNLASIELARNRYPLAILYADSAFRLARRLGFDRELVESLATRATIHELRGDASSALALRKEQLQLADSLTSQAQLEHLAELRSAYEQMGRYRDATLAEQRHYFRLHILLWGSVGLLGLLGLLFLLLWLRERKKRRHLAIRVEHLQGLAQEVKEVNRGIEEKQRELADLATLVESKNLLLQRAIARIEARRGFFKPANQQAMDALLGELRASLRIDQDWEQFKAHFERVHPDFFLRLLAIEEHLTPDDLRFCAYLRMNLTPKEMASLLSISTSAVRQRLYRLRKKLGQDSSGSLISFLLKL